MQVAFEEAAPPAEPEAIHDIEERLGVTLPEDYRGFLEAQNGGYLEPNTVDGATVRQLFSAGPTPVEMLRDIETVLEWYAPEPGLDEEGPPEGFLPIGADDFGNLVCLNVDAGDRGAVYHWRHEVANESESLQRLADSFTGFLQGLRPRSGGQ